MSDTHWPAYYQTVGVKPPRELLRHALTFFPEGMMQPAQALDLGCGTGSTTLELLRLGWRVDTIDQEPEAMGVNEKDRRVAYPPYLAQNSAGERMG